MGLVYLLGKNKDKKPYVDPEDGKIYGVSINLNERNPDLGVTYIEDAIGFTPARGNNGNFIYGSWKNKFPFDRIKPCILSDSGEVVTYLNPNNYQQDVRGNYVDVNTGSLGNVMVEFPTVYWKIEKIGSTLEVRYSKDKIDDSYKALAHTRNTLVKDKLYIGAYLANSPSTKLLSRSNQSVTTSQSMNTYRSRAKNNSFNHDIMGFYQLTLIQILFLVMFQSRNSQSALGTGIYRSGGSRNTGALDSYGMYYGSIDDTSQVKLFGIESIYGNYSQIIDGLKVVSGYDVIAGTYSFSEEPFTYKTIGNTGGTVSSVVLRNVIGTSEGGFFPTQTSTLSTDDGYYWASEANVSAINRFLSFGGNAGTAVVQGGIFNMEINITATVTNSIRTARLMYL